jgi:hypothetical protein
MANPLSDYLPQQLIRDVELMLQAVAYDKRMHRVLEGAARMVREARA